MFEFKLVLKNIHEFFSDTVLRDNIIERKYFEQKKYLIDFVPDRRGSLIVKTYRVVWEPGQ